MSKSLGNYIGIDDDATTMYTKVMKIPDNMIIKYYELCTDLHPDKIEEIKNRLDNNENPRDIKMELALEITRLYHSEEEAIKAEENFKTLFQKQQATEDTVELEFDSTSENITSAVLDSILSSGEYKSKAEIKRLLQQGAMKINGERIDSFENISDKDGDIILQIGKGRFYKLVASK